MKMKLLTVIAGIMVFSLANAALAADFQVNGSYRGGLRSLKDGSADKVDLGESKITLDFKVKAANDVTLFGRFAERNFWGGEQFTKSWNGTSNFDHYGVKVKHDDWDLSIGRQGVSLGQGGIISTGDEVGFNPYFDGVVVSRKLNNISANLLYGKTTTNDNIKTYYQGSNWLGADASVKLSDRATVGVAFAHEQLKGNVSKYKDNYAALNASINFGGPFVFNAEVVKSNADSDNRAVSLTGIYHQNKNSFIMGAVRSDKNAINQYTSIVLGGFQFPLGNNIGENNWKGIYYFFTHDCNKAVTFRLLYEDLHPAGQQHNHEYATGFDFKF